MLASFRATMMEKFGTCSAGYRTLDKKGLRHINIKESAALAGADNRFNQYYA